MSKHLSVGSELHLIANAIDALRAGLDRSERRMMAGSVALIRDRVLRVEAVVRGAIDPAQILCQDNEAHAEGEDDLVIEAWSNTERVRRCERALKVAKAKAALEQQGVEVTGTDFAAFLRDDILAGGKR